MGKSKSYARRKPFREPGKRILVVTEGTVTEPRYFTALLDRLQVSSRAVEVRPPNGSDPVSIVDTAISIVDQNKKNRTPDFDEIWLVLDTEDQRVRLAAAIDKARAHKFNLAISAPSIEYWFLLHFAYTTKYMVRCCEVEHELRNYFAYSKKQFDAQALVSRTGDAVVNARSARDDQEATGREFPRTDVDLLVTEINALADDANRLFDKLSDR